MFHSPNNPDFLLKKRHFCIIFGKKAGIFEKMHESLLGCGISIVASTLLLHLMFSCTIRADEFDAEILQSPIMQQWQQFKQARQVQSKNHNSFIYSTFGDWDDVPIFHQYAFGPHTFDRQVFADGRVAWTDSRSTGRDMYFKFNIPKEKVEKSLQRIKDFFESPLPLKRNNRVSYNEPFITALPYFSLAIHSRELFVRHSWDGHIIDSYRAKRKILQTDVLGEFLSGLKSIGLRDDYAFLNSIFVQHNVDRCDCSESSIVAIGRMFVADAEFFILFDEIMNGLLPTDQHLVPVPVKRQFRVFTVEKTKVNNNFLFEYKLHSTNIVPGVPVQEFGEPPATEKTD